MALYPQARNSEARGLGILSLSAGLWAASVGAFYGPLSDLFRLASDDFRYSHILTVPMVVAFLLWWKKDEIAPHVRPAPIAGIPLILAGLLMAVFPGSVIAGILVLWTGIAVVAFGPKVVWEARFPIALSLFVIPPPPAFMEHITVSLQDASANTAAAIFRLIGEPFQREGSQFIFSEAIVEVAEVCSGIRAAIVSELGALVVGYLVLTKAASRTVFALLCIPAVIAKNAIRIVSLVMLGLHVDVGYFTGDLHKYAGMPFAVLSAGMLLPALWALRRYER